VVSDKVSLLWEDDRKFLFLVIVNSVMFTALNGRAGKGESTSALPLCFFTYLHKLRVACLLLTLFCWNRTYMKVSSKNKVLFFKKKLRYVYKIRIKFWNNSYIFSYGKTRFLTISVLYVYLVTIMVCGFFNLPPHTWSS